MSSLSQSFTSLIGCFDLWQHVSEESHVAGHVLDLVLSRAADNFLSKCYVFDLITDHYAVHWYAKAHYPMRPVKAVEFRKLKSIDFASFCNDLSRSSFFASPVTNCQEAVIEYNATLSGVLDDHAPLIRRCFTVRPDNPWDSEEIHSSRRCVRRSERRWKWTKLTIDKEIMLRGLQELHNMINKARFSNLRYMIRLGRRCLSSG